MMYLIHVDFYTAWLEGFSGCIYVIWFAFDFLVLRMIDIYEFQQKIFEFVH